MKRKRRFETPATVGLGVVCAVLFLRLAVRVRGVNARAEQPVLVPSRLRVSRRAATVNHAGAPEAFPDGPMLDVALYNRGVSRPLNFPGRDPFAFEPTPQQVERSLRAKAAAVAQHNTPPPPPPLPFQAMGFSEGVEGNLQAYLADNQRIYVVHQGQTFDKNYSVLRITPGMIEIRDELLNRTIELPFPTP
ncbi:MAG: hypothetical protein ACRD2B_14025 [Terriglobia bacterium]